MGEWISVDEKLPEVNQYVLAYRPMADESNDQRIAITKYYGINHPSPQGIMHGFECWCHVTHWIPMPELPKDGE